MEKEKEFLDHLEKISKNIEIINISGSLPKGLDASFYQKIIKFAKENKIFVSLDTSGNTLKEIVKGKMEKLPTKKIYQKFQSKKKQ